MEVLHTETGKFCILRGHSRDPYLGEQVNVVRVCHNRSGPPYRFVYRYRTECDKILKLPDLFIDVPIPSSAAFKRHEFSFFFLVSDRLRIRIRYSGSGAGCCFDPWIWISFFRITDLGFPANICEHLVNICRVKNNQILCQLAT
jgi:hypothetical protein